MELVDKAQAEWERKRDRQQRWVKANPGKSHHSPDEIRYKDYRFVGWDGEAPKDVGYALFGSSDGDEICGKALTTVDFFELLISAKKRDKHTIFVWFGGRYDWDEICRRSIPLKKLSALKFGGTVHWNGYRIHEVPGKIYTIRRQVDGEPEVVLYEIHGWFHTPYAIALKNYQIGTPAEIERIISGKEDRPTFLWSEIEDIKEYYHLELKLMPPLMDRVRDIVLRAGFNPRGWYGPSALARELLTRHKVFKAKALCPDEVNNAACFAFAGGRFEGVRGGNIHVATWTYDKNSAYMHAALCLPNLAKGRWRHTNGQYEPGKFAVYHILYRDNRQFYPLRIHPLFRRLKNGNVCWPARVEGWYWSPEAELVKDSPYAQFMEAWVFDEDDPTDRPFSFVKEVFRQRLLLQNLSPDNPSRVAEIALKWALAAIYGQLARVVGWDRKKRLPPRTHQIEWAGYILSHCRADMFRLGVKAGESLLTIDTDSVTSLCEIDGVELGKELGQWKVDKADETVLFQNGVFFTKHGGEWSKGKSRGVEKRAKTPDLTPQMLIDAIEGDKDVKLTPRRKYITVKMALNGQYDAIGEWQDRPGNTLVFGGGGKRYHNRKLCWKYCSGEIHGFIPRPYGLEDPFDIMSCPHVLPWKQKKTSGVHTDTLWVNDDDLLDEPWLAQLVEKHAKATYQV